MNRADEIHAELRASGLKVSDLTPAHTRLLSVANRLDDVERRLDRALEECAKEATAARERIAAGRTLSSYMISSCHDVPLLNAEFQALSEMYVELRFLRDFYAKHPTGGAS